MKRKRIFVFAVIGILAFMVPALSGVPRLINYQGILTDDAGTALDGTHDLTFTVYVDSSLGASVLWSELHTGVEINGGLFNLILGSVSALPDTVFSDHDECWMGIAVDSDPEMKPRMQITSVPWALRAAIADSVVSGGGSSDDGDWTIATDDMYSAVPGNVGIGVSSPLAKLHVTSDGTVLFGADTLGAGGKAMWLPTKKAFRTGEVTGTDWDFGSIGDISFATGKNTRATGVRSTAMGDDTEASGPISTALGFHSNASGSVSTALGNSTHASGGESVAMGTSSTASGNKSTAMGYGTTASGEASTALGWQTKAQSFISTAIGRFNVGGGNQNSWIETDPLFEIGIGTELANSINALTVLKNGNVGIGTASPTYGLDVADTVQMTAFKMPTGATNGYVLTTDANGVGSWQAASGGADSDWTISGNNMYSGVPGNVGIGVAVPFAKLHVKGGENVLFGTDWNGAGSKLVWLPSKNSFRAGEVDGSQWDDVTVGNRSFAAGYNTVASGERSTALGYQTRATDYTATAMGDDTEASGSSSTAMGSGTVASGSFSTAMGIGTKAESRNSLAVGAYNVGGGNPTASIPTDPLFEVGHGGSDLNRMNALTVLKNGSVGIGTASPLARLHVLEGETVLFGTDTGGAGSKLMWLPTQAAFRAGYVDGTQWDTGSVGARSLASGWGTVASGVNSAALGNGSQATGSDAAALGYQTEASGLGAVAMGWRAVASGAYATAMGSGTKAESREVLAVGAYNVGGGNPTSWIDTDPLFEIGNGTFPSPSNAVTVLKNGNVGIGTATPAYLLDIADTVRVAGFRMPTGASDGYVLTSDVSGVGSWQAQSALSDGDWTMTGDDMYSNVSGHVGIGVSNPLAKLHVSSGDTVLFGADTQGAGNKLMWLPSSGAFRAGSVSGTEWDAGSVGSASFAVGQNTSASGDQSAAIGYSTTASGDQSTAIGYQSNAPGSAATAMGHSTTASGGRSTAMGFGTTASGDQSTAMGYGTTASGQEATAIGSQTSAESYASTAIGRFNVGGGAPSAWVETDPLFEVGIGTGALARENAMTVLKNGHVGVGTATPTYALDVADTVQMTRFKMPTGASDGYILTSDPNGVGAWQEQSVLSDGDWTISGDDMYSSVLGSVGIGTTTPAYALDVADTVQMTSFKMPTGASDGYILTSDPNGVGTWQEQSVLSDGDWTISGNDIYSGVTGNVGVGETSPIAKLHVTGSGTVLFGADTLGAGGKMMWLPSKRAFRAGSVGGTHWDPDSVGTMSFAAGGNTKALAIYATAFGVTTRASGPSSTALGTATKASGVASTAMGEGTTASGTQSTAMGAATVASGLRSAAMGQGTNADAAISLAIGRNNVGGGNATSWVDTDPLFEVGIGANSSNRANAVTVLKNGDVGIGTATPTAELDVVGEIRTTDGAGAVRSQIRTNSNTGVASTYGPNGNRNTSLTALASDTDYGMVAVYDATDTKKASMYVNPVNGDGVVVADVKNFRMKHPDQQDKEIWYACIEGPEAAAYVRGTAQLRDGKATITLPDHFVMVANEEGMTVQLTPLSAESKGLAVIEKKLDGIIVQELAAGVGNYEFDFVVMAVRKGKESYQVIRATSNVQSVPAATE